ncbi:MAG: hypothetical protein AABY30_01945 [Candidatus Thermoplasmatota archaeon]
MDDNNTPTPSQSSQTWKGIAFAILVGLSFAGGRLSVRPSGPQNRDPLQDQIRDQVRERVGTEHATPSPPSEENMRAAQEALAKAKRDLEQRMGLPPGELDKPPKEREERIPESK